MKRRINFDDIEGKDEDSKRKFNPYSGLPYSPRYFELLRTRQKLPVYEYRDRIVEEVKNNTTILIEGETGH